MTAEIRDRRRPVAQGRARGLALANARRARLRHSSLSEPSHLAGHAAIAILSHSVQVGRFGQARTAAKYARGGLPPRARHRVHEYIVAHLHEKISNDALAQVAGLSACHFARMFKQTEGISPHRYVLQCRIRRAQQLLADTDMPLSEIAIAAGFSDQSHYTRCFRATIGVTPGSYRWSTR
jgi:transcriptional regulator GlxA family with amidase domain